MLSKRTLAVELSRLQQFDKPKEHLEQYPTDSEVAADMLHNADMIDGIAGKHVVDLGAGTGILGIGCLMQGAKHVTFQDIDPDALTVLKRNIEATGLDQDGTIIHSALQAIPGDIVVMNPPFGTRSAHADRAFLEAAMQSAPVCYSLHLAGSERFITSLAKDRGYALTHTWRYELPLKQTLAHHRKRIEKVPVVGVRLERTERQGL